MHRLVQAVTADQMPEVLASQWRQAAAALIEAAIPDDTALPETWPMCAALLPHAQAALDLTSEGIWRIAEYLGESGNFPAARDLFQLIADAYLGDDAYGMEHRDTLAARGQLARWTGQAGDPAAARDLFAGLLPVRERVLGPEHPDTLTARHGLATWTADAGDPAAGRDLLAALLPMRERVLGPDHPDTLDSRHELAYWIGDAGDPAAARDMFAALLEVRERVSRPGAPGHSGRPAQPGLLDREGGGPGGRAGPVRRAAADARAGPRRGAPGRPDRPAASWPAGPGRRGTRRPARDLLAGLLPVRERVLGPDHPDALNRPAWPRPLDRGGR